MKRTSRFISTLALMIMALGAVPEADAALKARSATIDPATGYPTWYQDTNNLALTDCLDQNGFCIPAPTSLPLPTDKALISDANFPIESFYYMADTAGVSPGGVISVTIWEAAIEAGFVANAVDGGQAVFSRIRYRVNVTVPGTYVVTHPYGEETYVITTIDPGAHEINFTNDVPGLVPQDFDTAVTTLAPFQPPFVGPTFLTNATGAFITDPVSGNRYLGLPGSPVTVVGSPTGNNFVRIVGGGDTFLSTTFGLQGKVIGLDVAPKTSLNLGAIKIATPSAPQTVTVTNTTGVSLTFPALAAAGADLLDFAILPPPAGAVDCSGATITAIDPLVAGSGICSFNIAFTPTAVAKATRAATVLLNPTAAVVANNPPPVTLNLTGTALVAVTTTAVSPHGTITMEPTAIVTPAGTAPAGTVVSFSAAPTNAKFKVHKVEDGITLLGTPDAVATLPNKGPFTLDTGVLDHAVTATFMPSGDLDADGTLGLNDAMKALKIVAGVQQADVDDPDNSAVKVAPLVNGIPSAINAKANPDIGDVLVILRKVLNLDKW